MSDKPLGPGWWLASDGTWHPPELHPSIRVDDLAAAPAGTPPVSTATPESPGALPMLGDLADAASAVVAAHAAEAAEAAADPIAVGTPDDAPVATVAMPALGPLTPRPVPSLPGYPKRQEWSGESDHRADAGPMFPDLFQQAVNGSALANAITVNYADGEHRDGLDVPQFSAPATESPVLVAAGGRMPAEVGAFTGASAKKRRWRL